VRSHREQVILSFAAALGLGVLYGVAQFLQAILLPLSLTAFRWPLLSGALPYLAGLGCVAILSWFGEGPSFLLGMSTALPAFLYSVIATAATGAFALSSAAEFFVIATISSLPAGTVAFLVRRLRCQLAEVKVGRYRATTVAAEAGTMPPAQRGSARESGTALSVLALPGAAITWFAIVMWWSESVTAELGARVRLEAAGLPVVAGTALLGTTVVILFILPGRLKSAWPDLVLAGVVVAAVVVFERWGTYLDYQAGLTNGVVVPGGSFVLIFGGLVLCAYGVVVGVVRGLLSWRAGWLIGVTRFGIYIAAAAIVCICAVSYRGNGDAFQAGFAQFARKNVDAGAIRKWMDTERAKIAAAKGQPLEINTFDDVRALPPAIVRLEPKSWPDGSFGVILSSGECRITFGGGLAGIWDIYVERSAAMIPSSQLPNGAIQFAPGCFVDVPDRPLSLLLLQRRHITVRGSLKGWKP